MTPAEFKKKWAQFSGKETAAYQEHFSDLCAMLGQDTPVSADPTGNDTFCFQKRVLKDAELFMLGEESAAGENGFADVWKKGCFAWEYKGRKKNLDLAYRQLQRYRESLENPPLLAVCDYDPYIVRTNFNGTVQDVHEFTNAQIDEPRNLRVLRALFTDPEFLRPTLTTAKVTEDLASDIAKIARSLQGRESVAYVDAKTRREQNLARRKNLEIARFLNRIIFCFFAEDVELLPTGIFTEVTKAGLEDPHFFAERLGELFQTMATGGAFGAHKIRHFNGHLFEDATVFELTPDEISALAAASEADWQSIEPSILGTLFERGLDPDQRSQLGAHYTSRADIETLVEPVLMAPLRQEWQALKQQLRDAHASPAAAKKALAAFLEKLGATTVLDPACGSGNFLYVALQMLLDLEKTVLNFAAQYGQKFAPRVDVQQLRALEINPYAFELAQVSVQIGWLQWRRDNGFPLDRTPVLQTLDGFQNADALLVTHFRNKPKTLKEAREREGSPDKALMFFTERDWPDSEIIVSNPPFLGDKLMRGELGDDYVSELRKVFEDRIPGQSDLCCYWFEKARRQIEKGRCRRAGLLATQGIRGSANREVLKRIKNTGNIFFAESDRNWILNGANVHVSMVGFDNGAQKNHTLNKHTVASINADLSAFADVSSAVILVANAGVSFIGTCKGGAFDIEEREALELLNDAGNPNCRPDSDVLKPILNATEVTNRSTSRWLIDFEDMTLEEAALYEAPFKIICERVKPLRDKNRNAWLKANWWKLQRIRPEMREKIGSLSRFISTPRHSKHRVFTWYQWPVISDDATVVFAREDDLFFGILHSRFHEIWARSLGTQVRERESGFRYTPTTCFETFPLPEDPSHSKQRKKEPEPRDISEADVINIGGWLVAKERPGVYGSHFEQIEAAASELNTLRENWLNPPEWAHEEELEFPGSDNGPWSNYVRNGWVYYPRLVAKDAECAAKLKERTLTNLYNERPAWLELAHQKLDAAVAAAYGWPADVPDEEVLERLLALNLERAKAERFAGKKKVVATREKRDDEML